MNASDYTGVIFERAIPPRRPVRFQFASPNRSSVTPQGLAKAARRSISPPSSA